MNKNIKSFLEWTINSDDQILLKELKVIDFHSHIWNILSRDENQIFWDNQKFPIDIRTIWGNFWWFKAPWRIFNIIMHTKVVDDILKESWKIRNSSANLKTFNESMNNSFIDKAVCLPIPPHQYFSDLNKAREIDNRIISFTWVDFSKPINLDKLDKQFKLDIELWAKWLKIHPIIQWVNPNWKDVEKVVELWSKYDLPIIFHTWVTEYCKKSENCNIHKPEYWEIKYFINLAKNYPEAKIVIWHSWLFDVDQVIELLSKYDNVSVDTSFQWVQKIRELMNSFWEERLMFASDWPYWDRVPAVNVMLDALNRNNKLVEKIMKTNWLNLMNIK